MKCHLRTERIAATRKLILWKKENVVEGTKILVCWKGTEEYDNC